MFTEPCVGNRAEMVLFKEHCANLYLFIPAVTHHRSCFYWPYRHKMAFLVWNTGLPGSMEASPEALLAIHFLHFMGTFILFCCSDVWVCPAPTHSKHELSSLKTAFRFPLKSDMLSPVIYSKLEFIRLICQWIYCTYSDSIVPTTQPWWDHVWANEIPSARQGFAGMSSVKENKFKGLEHPSYNDTLGETGLLSPEKRRIREVLPMYLNTWWTGINMRERFF